MKRKNSNNTWLYTICIVLIAIVFGFLSFIPVNIECIKPFIAYFDPNYYQTYHYGSSQTALSHFIHILKKHLY